MDEDCIVETEIPVKEKKLKQARLPFQRLSTSESSKSLKPSKESPSTNKKRKLTSPLLNENKNSKIIKITSKENDTADVPDVENEIIVENNDQNSDKIDAEKKKNKNLTKTKTENKNQPKSDILTRFLVRADKDVKKSLQDNVDVKKIDKNEVQEMDICNSSVSEVKILRTRSVKKTVYEEENASETSENEKNIDTSIQHDSNTSSSSSDEEDESEMSQTEDLNKSLQSLTPKSKATTNIVNSDRKKITPKQLQKQVEREKKIEERKKMRMEKEKKREEERENRRKEKEEKRREKEEKEKKDKAEKEQKRKEKEQKQKEKEALEKKKEEEKRKKKEAKEEEERRKEEEKLEAERKQQKTVSNFIGFFVAKKPEIKSSEEKQTIKFTNFMPFEVKADMKMAPINRREINEDEKLKLDELRTNININDCRLYLDDMKSSNFVIRRSEKTFPLEMKDEDVVIIEEEDGDEDDGNTVVEKGNIPLEKYRPKLLYFHENRRPPYWGTWRKNSTTINPRKPLAKDNKWFDYEVDSDDEWEEEEPGESLHGSDDEKDEENAEENEYDVDNEFMVPHGYLSDEEVREDEEEEEDTSPETQKFKLKVLGEEFEAERNEKTLKLKPKVIGCIWLNSDSNFPENTSGHAILQLSARKVWVFETPIIINTAPDVDNRNVSDWTTSGINSEEKSTRGAKKKNVPEEAMQDLIRLVHGNVNNRNCLAKEFATYWNHHKNGEQSISKRSFFVKLREIASWMVCPDDGPMHQKQCWYVAENIRKQYFKDKKLDMPNKWSYVVSPMRKSEITEKDDKCEKEDKKNLPLITQFAKKITQEEMKKQLTEMKSTPPLIQQRPPKRATLISVGRGEQLPKSPRVSLLDKFVAASSKTDEVDLVDDDNNGIIIIHDDNEENSKKCATDSFKGNDKRKKVKEVSTDKNSDSSKDKHIPME